MTATGDPHSAFEFSRRSFLKTATGTVAISILGLPLAKSAQAQAWSPTPGIANQRYEGVTKVTGEKIFARDYSASDLSDYGWPAQQWHALYLRALTTTRAFMDVDLGNLPVTPTKVILGNNFATGRLSPPVGLNRDRIVDNQIQQAIATGDQIDHPDGLVFDLVVQPGNRPDFLGQAVALLLFDKVQDYRAAKRALQFNDAAFQIYGPEIGPNPDAPTVFDPTTLYVKQGDFSYYSADPDSYATEAANRQTSIEQELQNPDLITYDFTCEMQAMDPMFMEPESGLVWYDETKRHLHLLIGTQSPDGDVADICGMYFKDCKNNKPLDHVTLISCYPGGGFGGRDSSPFSLMLALAADFAEGNPVRLEYDRFDQFRVGLKRHACDLTGTIAVKPDQTLDIVQMNMNFDGGGRKNLSPYVAQLAALCAGGSYRVPTANIYAQAVHSQNISGGSQRGFGGPQAFFAIETAIDEVCLQNGWDPLAFRQKNVVVPYQDSTVVGGPIQQSLQLPEMLDRTLAHPLWADRAAIKAGHAQQGRMYGTGLAMSLQAYGTSGDGVVAGITLAPDGTWALQADSVDMGNGSATTLGVVIGPILGANASKIEMGDYQLFAKTGLSKAWNIGEAGGPSWQDPTLTKKSVGSSSACLTGLHKVHVMRQCAQAVKDNVILPAVQIMLDDYGLTSGDISWDNGMAIVAGQAIPLADIATLVYDFGLVNGAVAHAYFQEIWVNATYQTDSGSYRYDLDALVLTQPDGALFQIPRQDTTPPPASSDRESRFVWAPCVNVVGLTVDPTNGQTQIENVLSVLNAGQIHVPELVSGMSQGGVAMATGYTLLEDMPPGMDGPANGTWNLNEYHVPRYADMPLATEYAPGGRAQELIVMPDLGETTGRGIAEAVMCSIAPAISNALRDATGVRFTALPITADKILEGLGS